jgi:putative (di)nucleoside polyphosphate hydrolase
MKRLIFIMKKYIKNKTFRENVAAIIINSDKKILMCEHAWIDGAFQFPQGGVDKGEKREEALLRELGEELGTNKFKIIEKMDEKIKYHLPPQLKEKYGSDGQIQTYFLVYFYGKDKDIRFDNQPKPEFKSLIWVNTDEPPKKVIYFKKISYLKAIEYFKEKIKELDFDSF